jgi:hypothetical protein
MKKYLGVSALVLLCFTSLVLWAEGLEVPEGDPLAAALALWTQWKTATPIAIGSLIITFVVQALKKFLPSSGVTRVVVVLGGVAYTILQKIMTGMGWAEALVLVLLTMGGAVLIYEMVIKPLFPKKPVQLVAPK